MNKKFKNLFLFSGIVIGIGLFSFSGNIEKNLVDAQTSGGYSSGGNNQRLENEPFILSQIEDENGTRNISRNNSTENKTTEKRPTISGSSKYKNANITVKINGNTISGNYSTDSDGNYSFKLNTDLRDGKNKIEIFLGSNSSAYSTFDIYKVDSLVSSGSIDWFYLTLILFVVIASSYFIYSNFYQLKNKKIDK